MEVKSKHGLIGEDVKVLPIGQLLKRVGPGLIATGIVVGPGAVTTASMLGAGINKETGMESKFVRYGCLACLVFAMIICYSFNGSPTQLILLANIATSIATPVAGLFVVLLIWRKDVNKGYKTPTLLRVCMTLSYIFVLVMTGFAFATSIIPNICTLFGGA